MLTRSHAFAAVISALASSCGSSAPEAATATSTSGGESDVTRVQQVAEFPLLTERQLADDAANPDVIVDEASRWVLVPSFDLGFQVPNWHWESEEERRARTTLYTGREVSARVLHTYRATVTQWSMNDASHAGELIPSLRIFLIPLGGTPPRDACARTFIQLIRSVHPDAQFIRDSWQTIEGRPMVRCTYDHTSPSHTEAVPRRTELAAIVGESHSILIVSLGPQTDEVAANLDAVLATARPLQ